MSERFPTDRGAIMGLYSVFLALGQIIGSLIGGVAADWLGIDGMFIATLDPARHRGRAAGPAADAGAPARAAPADRRDPGVTDDRRVEGPWPLARGSHGAVVAPNHLATGAGLAILRAGGSAVDAAIATNAVLGVVQPASCGIGGDAFWLIWDAAAGRQVALNGSGRAGSRADAAFLRASGLTEIPARGPLVGHGPGRGPLVGRRPRAVRAAVAGRDPGAGHRAGTGRVPGDAPPSSTRSSGSRPRWPPRSARMPASSRSSGRTAARGSPASGSGSRPSRPRSTTLADDGFDAFYEGDLARPAGPPVRGPRRAR